jgi:hypothetical protein
MGKKAVTQLLDHVLEDEVNAPSTEEWERVARENFDDRITELHLDVDASENEQPMSEETKALAWDLWRTTKRLLPSEVRAAFFLTKLGGVNLIIRSADHKRQLSIYLEPGAQEFTLIQILDCERTAIVVPTGGRGKIRRSLSDTFGKTPRVLSVGSLDRAA